MWHLAHELRTSLILLGLACLLNMNSISSLDQTDQCPVGCSCRAQDTGMITGCEDQGFTQIPHEVSNNTWELYFQGNNIPVLEKDVFQKYPLLRTIVLTHSGIHNLQPGAFNGLEDLTSLDLRDNKIKILRSYIFSSLKKLERIVLDRNRIRTIESYAFAGTGRLYEGLSMSFEHNTHLQEIQPHAFEGANIEELYILNSSLVNSSLEAFRDLKHSLSMLFLISNKLPLHFPNDLFLGFKKLHGLSLENNGINDASFLQYTTASDISLSNNPLGVVDFSRFPSLKNVRSFQIANTNHNSVQSNHFKTMLQLSQLHIARNDIYELPEQTLSLFSRLQYISLSENLLHCNCELLWLKDWLRSANTRVEGAECSTPFKTAVRSADVSLFTCSPPSSITISQEYRNGHATLACTSNGDPSPNITWLNPEKVSMTEVQPDKLSGNTKALYNIQDTDKSGVYTCRAENIKGSKISTIKLDVFKTIAKAGSQKQNHSSFVNHDFLSIIVTCVLIMYRLYT